MILRTFWSWPGLASGCSSHSDVPAPGEPATYKKKHTYIWRTIWDVLDLCRKLDTLFSVNGWRQNGNDFQPRRVCVELLQRSAAAENSREIAGIRVISISVAAASFKCNFQLRKLSGRDCKFKTSGPTSTSTKSYVARCLFLLAVMTSCKAPRTLQLIKALGKICHSFKDKLRNKDKNNIFIKPTVMNLY